jgi:hypothetical protein
VGDIAEQAADRSRRPGKTGASSKPAYSAILEWRDRTLADRFSAAVIEPILEKHGAGALDSGRGR